MKMNVKFETTEQVFNVGFSQRGKTFSTSVKDVIDLTDGQKEIAYQNGYTEGHTEGHETGYEIGRAAGYEQGYDTGAAEGLVKGYESGHADGLVKGREDGYSEGQEAGYQTGHKDGLAEGYDAGHATGKAEGRSSLDLLPNLELEKIGAYLGKSLASFGDQKLIILLTLKKGKAVPAGSLGHIYQPPGGGTSAAWIVSGGTFTASRAVQQTTPSRYLWSMVGCYPSTEETWNAFMDAFEVRVERIETEL